MKRAVPLLLAALLALPLSACEPEKSNGGNHQPAKPPKPPVQQPQPQPGAQQPAPVQGDPNAHNTQTGELDLHVEWISENRRTPACEWSLNAPGQGQPCANMEHGEHADPGDTDYIGFWEHTVPGAKAGDVVFLSAEGAGTKSLKCSYFWKGSYHSLPDDGGRHCGGTATLN